MTLEEFLAMPELMSYFPLTFEPERQRYTGFSVQCASCEKPIAVKDTRGYVVPVFEKGAYRDTPKVAAYHMTADALCKRCNKITPAEYILRRDMTMTGKGQDGSEKTWGMRKLKWWERALEELGLRR